MEVFSENAIASLEAKGFEMKFCSHARAILEVDFPGALSELASVLLNVTIPVAELIAGGGGEAKCTQRMRRELASFAWEKTNFEITKTVNGKTSESISHEVDHVRRMNPPMVSDERLIALEIEWNNKDPFFDRDLENFKRLHLDGVISVGIIVTRGSSLQSSLLSIVQSWADAKNIDSYEDLETRGIESTSKQKAHVLKRANSKSAPVGFREAWVSKFVSDKYGAATTHWSKLMDRVSRGVGNPCPLLLVGLPASVVET